MTKQQMDQYIANAMIEFLIALSPETQVQKKAFFQHIDWRIYVSTHGFNHDDVVARLAALGSRSQRSDVSNKTIFDMEHPEFLDLIAQAMNLKILTSPQLTLIAKWHPRLDSISQTYRENYYLLNIPKSLATSAINELAAIGIPAKIMEGQPANEEDYALLTFDYEKTFDFSKLIPSMLSMRKQVAAQVYQFNGERLTGAEFLERRRYRSITGLTWGFTKQELQCFSDFVSQFDPHAKIEEQSFTPLLAIGEHVEVIFQSSSAREQFEAAIKKLGLSTYIQSYSKPNGCFISLMNVYTIIHSYSSLKNNPLLNTNAILPIINSYLPDNPLNMVYTTLTRELIKSGNGLFAVSPATNLSASSSSSSEGSKASDSVQFRPGM